MTTADKDNASEVSDSRRGKSYLLRGGELAEAIRRGSTDRIDLYQMHMPDPETPTGGEADGD